MPGIDAIRPLPLDPPPEIREPGAPLHAPPDVTEARGDSVELSPPLRLVNRPSEPRAADVATENARAAGTPEPGLLSNQYGRAVIEQDRVRFFAVDGGSPGPLEIINEEV